MLVYFMCAVLLFMAIRLGITLIKYEKKEEVKERKHQEKNQEMPPLFTWPELASFVYFFLCSLMIEFYDLPYLTIIPLVGIIGFIQFLRKKSNR